MKYQVGDRVRVYFGLAVYTGFVRAQKPDSLIVVTEGPLKGQETLYVHPKQCRKIVKKNKPKSIWYKFSDNYFSHDHYTWTDPKDNSYTEFREIKKK